MSDDKDNSSDNRFNDTLKRMLKTPPTPHDDKARASERLHKMKPGGPPAKNDHPEEDS